MTSATPSASGQTLRATSIALLGAALSAVGLLHLISPDLTPTRRRLSEYANGPYGYVMTAAFFAVGAGLFTLAWGVASPRDQRWRPRFAPAGLAVAGAGMVLSGVFPTDPDSADSMREAIHSLASGVASVALISTAVGWAVLGRRRATAPWLPSATAVLFATAAALVGLASPRLHRSTWTGLSQRALWVALLGWLFCVALSLRQRARPDVSADVRATSASGSMIDP